MLEIRNFHFTLVEMVVLLYKLKYDFPFMYDKMYTPILFFGVIHIHLMLHVQIVQKQIYRRVEILHQPRSFLRHG